MENKVIEIENLSTVFGPKKEKIRAIDGVSFYVCRGEMVGIVGESGCGKSVTSQSIMRLYDEKEEVSYSGTVRFEGENLMEIPYKEMDKIRGNRIAMIFQDALSSLNPVYTVGNQVVEAICIHQNVEKKEAWQKAVEMLTKVGISEPEKRMRQCPHELSGGMRQRVMIAIALCCKPDLLIADEPTTALDVTVQAQIMDLIQQLKEEENMGVILITHDMAVVAENCDRVIVMYLGQMVEEASVTDIFEHPLHPYTIGLIQSIPQMTTDSEQELFMIKGSLPLLTQIKKGCRFASRCPYATDKCREEEPELQKTGENHSVRCHFPRFGE
ncbi:MAG: ABC transporter ATP-binding protein [Roseburia inulinivorans]|nr:ABC transporter ATP-binding protein [Roseburia inulinivorans]